MGGGPGASKYGTLSHSLCAAAFLALTLFSLWRIMEPLPKVQQHDLRFRVYWCVKCAIYVCVMSFWVSVLHVTNFETIVWAEMGMATDNIIKPLEYIITCPAMMLIIVVLAGDKVPARRQMEVMGLTVCVLILGFAAVQTPAIPAKMMFFGSGVTFFLTLMYRVNQCVKQHSEGKECLFSGGPMTGSIYRKLCFKTAATWVLFPVWFLLSPEGLAVVSDKDAATLITAVLNIFSKAFFILYVVHIYEDFVSEESLMHHGHKKVTHEDQQAAEAAARLGPAQAIAAMQTNIRASQECIAKIHTLMEKDHSKKAEHEKAHADRMLQAGAQPIQTVTGPAVEFTGYAHTMGGFLQPPSAPMTHRSQMGLTPQPSCAAAGPPVSTAMAPPPYTQQTQAFHCAAPPNMPPAATGTFPQQAYTGEQGVLLGVTVPEYSTMPPQQPMAPMQAQQFSPQYMQPYPSHMQQPVPPAVPALPLDTIGSHDGQHKLQTTAEHGSSVPVMLGAPLQALVAVDDNSDNVDFPTIPEVAPTMQAPISVFVEASGGGTGVQGKVGSEDRSTWGSLRGRRGTATEVGKEADASKSSVEHELDP